MYIYHWLGAFHLRITLSLTKHLYIHVRVFTHTHTHIHIPVLSMLPLLPVLPMLPLLPDGIVVHTQSTLDMSMLISERHCTRRHRSSSAEQCPDHRCLVNDGVVGSEIQIVFLCSVAPRREHHQMDFSGTSVLAREPDTRKRCMLEAWFIRKHNTLNKEDECLPPVYGTLP